MDHEAIRQTVAAYTLNAVDGDERVRAQQDLLDHLPGCEECTALLRDFRETVADLAVAPSPAQLSPDLEQRIMSAIREDGTPSVIAVSSRRRRLVRAAVVAAAITIVGSWATTGVVIGSLQRESGVRNSLNAALSVAGDPSARVTTLHGLRGRILVAVSPDGRVALMAGGIPAPPDDRVLELWLFSAGRPVPVAVFSTRDGSAIVLATVAPASYEAAAITYEREFVSVPTGDPVYRAELGA